MEYVLCMPRHAGLAPSVQGPSLTGSLCGGMRGVWGMAGPCRGQVPRARCLVQAQGGEDMLLDEFEGLGLHCEARTQLVVLCEVCQRPSTKDCWTCGMKICDFCTLKRHWKVGSVWDGGLL